MQLLTILVIFLVVVGYLFIGAAVFQKLESDHEQVRKTFSSKTLTHFLEGHVFLLETYDDETTEYCDPITVLYTDGTKLLVIQNGPNSCTTDNTILEDSSSCVNRTGLDRLVRDVIDAYKAGVDAGQGTDSVDNWNFGSSFFFSTTVVTTIGYGHISPSTRQGRIFCIVYALLGIPMAAVFFAAIGKKLQKPLKALKRRVCCPRAARLERAIKTLVTGLLGVAILVLLPALGFHRLEDWSYLEAVYYCVITISTVGFGDFVPGQQDKDYRTYRQVVTIIWIFIGLSWLSMLLSEMGDYLSDRVCRREAAHKVDKENDNESSEDLHENGKVVPDEFQENGTVVPDEFQENGTLVPDEFQENGTVVYDEKEITAL